MRNSGLNSLNRKLFLVDRDKLWLVFNRKIQEVLVRNLKIFSDLYNEVFCKRTARLQHCIVLAENNTFGYLQTPQRVVVIKTATSFCIMHESKIDLKLTNQEAMYNR